MKYTALHKHSLTRMLGLSVLCTTLHASVGYAATNVLANPSVLNIHKGKTNPQELAERHERSGRKHEAAALGRGEANRKMIWLNRISVTYLAGVYEKVGDSIKARHLLEETASTPKTHPCI